jgi:outer membrane protein assembly factor BamD
MREAKMTPLMSRLVLPLVAAAMLGACGGALGSGTAVEYSTSAAQNYERGMRKLEEEEWMDAAKYFAFLKARFPYSKFAVLSDLRLGDAQFGAGGYLEAIDTYKLFIKFHPTHEQVQNGYAAFKIAESNYKLLPNDWVLLPPSYEKDQGASLDAIRELRSFLRDHPNSPYLPRAKEMYQRTAKRLADHEWYVANFYWKKKKWRGTILRLRVLRADYPGTGYDEEALYLLGRAYVNDQRKEDAKKVFEELVAKYPKHRHASSARSALGQLK